MAKPLKVPGTLTEAVGNRGESIFELAITDYSQFDQPLFREAFLGEKWPALDYVVELVGVKGMSPFFFVQVKSTSAAMGAVLKPDRKGIYQIPIAHELTPQNLRVLYNEVQAFWKSHVHKPSESAFV